MADLGKVIAALECCQWTDERMYCDCIACPYYDNINGHCGGIKQLHEDALALLKEQQPRVMTAVELRKADIYWIEYKDQDGCFPALSGTIGYTCFPYVLSADPGDRGNGATRHMEVLAEYGKTWRCWTSRPDEKVRIETPWES